MSIEEWLSVRGVDKDVAGLVTVLSTCVREVGDILANSPVGHVGTQNAFGDAQLSVDVLGDEKIFQLLTDSRLVRMAASEEQPELRLLSPEGKFTVCFDPVDGSSIVDCNWAVGSLFAVWGGEGVVGKCGRDQVLSAMAVYGPRTTLIVAIAEIDQVFELTLVRSQWVVTAERLVLDGQRVKIFSPANLRSANDLPSYQSLLCDWQSRKLTLRYTGGLVPDIAGLLVKGGGIFCSPVSPSAPAKLRLVFECLAVGLIVELAEGAAFDGDGNCLLDVRIQGTDQRAGLVAGSREEVDRVVRVLAGPVGS